MRADGSILVSAYNHSELWYVPPAEADMLVEPLLLLTLSLPPLAIIEVEPDIFYIATSEVYTTHESYLQRLDLRSWTPDMPVSLEAVLKLTEPVRGLNGGCLIAPNTILLADMYANLIWRVDIAPDSGKATASVWLKHASMDFVPVPVTKPLQPGVNGVKYAFKTNYLYYTSTGKQLFMRVRVDPATYQPADEPEFVAGGRMADDFCIDEDANVAYLATHRQNTIDRVSLEPSGNRDFGRHSVVGDPFTEELIGPASAAWGRGPREYGKVAYFLTDGRHHVPSR